MKIALYIEDGLEQIVLTPENKVETGLLNKLSDGQSLISVHRGEFYECQGGYVRHGSGARSTARLAQSEEGVTA